MGLLWFAIDRSLAGAAIVALFLGDVVAIIAGNTKIIGPLLGAHVVLLVAMLAVAWITEEHAIATAAVPLLAVATALSRTQTPRDEFVFAGVIFAVFLAYPLLLGARAKRSIHPYLAAVLASV